MNRTAFAALVALGTAWAADLGNQVYVRLAALPAGKLQVRVAAAESCRVMVVAFDRDGKIVSADQPVMIEMEAGSEQQIGTGAVAAGELDVLLIDNKQPQRRSLAQLVDAMHEQVAPAVRTRQISELRRMIDSLTQRDTASTAYSVKSQPAQVGGLLRGKPCDWCKDAQRVALPEAGSYLIRQRFP